MPVRDTKDLVGLIRNTLSLVDPRLVEHGERVAFLLFKMLQYQNKYTKQEILDFCTLAVFHDIGAYKTEVIDQMVEFETEDVNEHSVYGYLFIKNMTPLYDLADIILYHHIPYQDQLDHEGKHKEIALMLFLADRIDIYLTQHDIVIDDNFFEQYRNVTFNSEHIDLFIAVEKTHHVLDKITTGEYLTELMNFLDTRIMTREEIHLYIKMLVFSIDFRSEHTMLHTLTTISIACEIAKRLSLDVEEITKIYYGSLLHDLGKVTTPLSILEKQGKLTEEEMTTMKKHALYTEQILTGHVEEDILHMAIRHHEKLDGTGYPHGLFEDELTIGEKIIAVADIISALIGKRSYKNSFSKDEVLTILEDMVNQHKISSAIVQLIHTNYDSILQSAMKQCKDGIIAYTKMKDEFLELTQSKLFDC